MYHTIILDYYCHLPNLSSAAPHVCDLARTMYFFSVCLCYPCPAPDAHVLFISMRAMRCCIGNWQIDYTSVTGGEKICIGDQELQVVFAPVSIMLLDNFLPFMFFAYNFLYLHTCW